MKKTILLLAVILLISCNDDKHCTSPQRFKGSEIMSKGTFINTRLRLKLTDSLATVYQVDYLTIKIPNYEASKYHCGDIIE